MTSSSGSTLPQARWTHVALPVGDLDKSIEFYTSLTPLVVVDRFEDADGESAWLSNDKQVETPFVLVLVGFNKDKGGQHGVLKPFAHIGVEVPNRSDVDELAAKARELGVLHWEPQYVNEQVGYVCALRDPDGNVIEISHDQKVFETVRKLWGSGS
ncbi:VOC family protein [Phytohabitans rumicis]|uniref:VOC family protein n=1 Tax=Phytohabitans rumicis TaxID=1076125 RepID=UPI0015657F30|nr:VOC family protein [Phytohabitans rumicis]